MMNVFLDTDIYNLIVTDGHILIYSKKEVVNVFSSIGRLITRRAPMLNWFIDSKIMMKKIDKHVPGYLCHAFEAEVYEDEVMVAEIVEEESLKDDLLEVECPVCGSEFNIRQGQRQLKCPSCGVEGEV